MKSEQSITKKEKEAWAPQTPINSDNKISNVNGLRHAYTTTGNEPPEHPATSAAPRLLPSPPL